MKGRLCALMTLVAVVTIGCTNLHQQEADPANHAGQAELKEIVLQFPELPGWRLARGFMMLVKDPLWTSIRGTWYDGIHPPAGFYVFQDESAYTTRATDGVLRFKLPDEASEWSWAKISVMLFWETPRERNVLRPPIPDIYLYQDIDIPSGMGLERLNVPFNTLQGRLRPEVSVGDIDADEFLRQRDKVITEMGLLLRDVAVKGPPVFTGLTLVLEKPVHDLQILGNLPLFGEFPEASGLLYMDVGIGYEPGARYGDETYLCCFTVDDPSAKMAEDASLVSQIGIDELPVSIATSPDQQNKILGLFAMDAQQSESNTVPRRTCCVRVSGQKEALLYLNSGVAYNLFVFDNIERAGELKHLLIPVQRPDKLTVDLTDLTFKGFSSFKLDRSDCVDPPQLPPKRLYGSDEGTAPAPSKPGKS